MFATPLPAFRADVRHSPLCVVQKLTAGRFKYLIGSVHAPSQPVDATVVRDAVAALHVFQRCAGDFYAMQILRAHVSEVQRAEAVHHLSDVAVVDLAARLVGWGQLRLIGPVPRIIRAVGAVAGGAAAPEPAAAAPAASSGRAAPSAPADAAAPSFILNLDSALLASMLRDASNDGTPFCEECARAARAA